jgi:hypothetical protein
MPTSEIIDIFPAFLTWWDKAQYLPIEEQISGWEKDYISTQPELFQKLLENYTALKADWRQIARDIVFPHLPNRLPAMRQAHLLLLQECRPVLAKAQELFGLNNDVVFVIYTGIGAGAGWATKYTGLPAVLFGLENIAECGWNSPEAVRGLIAHELGHLGHYHWREQQKKINGSGPWWRLYEEGFAQYCEAQITGTDIPHQALSNNTGEWLAWCRQNRALLAREFLDTEKEGKPVYRFFGSWYEIHGKSETGYYLGAETIRELKDKYSLKDIALIDDIAVYLQPIIEKTAR